MKKGTREKPLVTEFWIMEKYGREYEFQQEFDTEKKMLASFKRDYSKGNDEGRFVPAILTVMRWKP